MSKGTILVTGGTGFVGSHIISQLLEKGYHVRATARSTSKLQSIFSNVSSELLEIVQVPSLTSDHSEALKGVDALIHTAAPIFGESVTGKDIFVGGYEGTLNIVKQAIAARVKKVIATGTFVSLFDSNMKDAYGTSRVFIKKDFGTVTLQTIDVNSPNGLQVYQESKTLADKGLWEVAHEHPDVDFTVIVCPGIYGPQLTPLTSSPTSLGTNGYVKMLFAPEYPPIPIGHMIDVRDAARAHVLALDAPPVPGRDKRFLILNQTFTWKDVAALIRRKKPELSDRLPKEGAKPVAQTTAPFDTTFTKEVLGFVSEIPMEETFLASVDVILDWERKFGENA